jgi:hypothetical protein
MDSIFYSLHPSRSSSPPPTVAQTYTWSSNSPLYRLLTCRHYKFALTEAFEKFGFSHVIIIEDDLSLSPVSTAVFSFFSSLYDNTIDYLIRKYKEINESSFFSLFPCVSFFFFFYSLLLLRLLSRILVHFLTSFVCLERIFLSFSAERWI